MQDSLAQLRDIHIPPEPSWWPLAPGWWIVASSLLIITALGYYIYKRTSSAQAVVNDRKTITIADYRKLFAHITTVYERSNDDVQLIQQSSMLLRKIITDSNNTSSKLTGEKWFDQLTITFGEDLLAEYKNILLYEQYAAHVTLDSVAFITSIEACLQKLEQEAKHA